jgi:hypothetical protein
MIAGRAARKPTRAGQAERSKYQSSDPNVKEAGASGCGRSTLVATTTTSVKRRRERAQSSAVVRVNSAGTRPSTIVRHEYRSLAVSVAARERSRSYVKSFVSPQSNSRNSLAVPRNRIGSPPAAASPRGAAAERGAARGCVPGAMTTSRQPARALPTCDCRRVGGGEARIPYRRASEPSKEARYSPAGAGFPRWSRRCPPRGSGAAR